MTILAYLFIVCTIVFFGVLIAGVKSKDEDQKHYGAMFFGIVGMAITGLLLSLGVLGLLPELTWR